MWIAKKRLQINNNDGQKKGGGERKGDFKETLFSSSLQPEGKFSSGCVLLFPSYSKFSFHHFLKQKLFWDRTWKQMAGQRWILGVAKEALGWLCFIPISKFFSNQQVEQVVYFSHIIFFLMASTVPSAIIFAFQTATWLHWLIIYHAFMKKKLLSLLSLPPTLWNFNYFDLGIQAWFTFKTKQSYTFTPMSTQLWSCV